MTSGLSNWIVLEGQPNRAGTTGKGEDNVQDALTNWDYVEDNRGSFQYLGTSNILSYVIHRITNLTPGEYFASNILPELGIDEIIWEKNGNGIEHAFVGMSLTSLQQAKFGQVRRFLVISSSLPSSFLHIFGHSSSIFNKASPRTTNSSCPNIGLTIL
jgi:hypothetical protein